MFVSPSFTVTVELPGRAPVQHPYHLGTDEAEARRWVEGDLPKRLAYQGFVTMALWWGREIVDVWDGDAWQSDVEDWGDEPYDPDMPPC